MSKVFPGPLTDWWDSATQALSRVLTINFDIWIFFVWRPYKYPMKNTNGRQSSFPLGVDGKGTARAFKDPTLKELHYLAL